MRYGHTVQLTHYRVPPKKTHSTGSHNALTPQALSAVEAPLQFAWATTLGHALMARVTVPYHHLQVFVPTRTRLHTASVMAVGVAMAAAARSSSTRGAREST